MQEYRLGQFDRREAACYGGHRVTLTTHPGDKTGEGSETFTNMLLIYPPASPYVMLGEKLPDGEYEIKTIEEV